MTADATFWDNVAERYAQQPLDNPVAFERKIAVTRGLMSPQDTVLDIGCGTGSLALRLAPYAAQVHGLDLSKEMIRIARGKTETAAADNVNFSVGPFDETFNAFEPGSLDGICAYSFLHLVTDPGAALTRIYSLLKPGGYFVSSTICLREGWAPIRPLIKMMQWLGKAPLVTMLSKDALAQSIEEVGFIRLDRPEVGAPDRTLFAVAHKPRHPV